MTVIRLSDFSSKKCPDPQRELLELLLTLHHQGHLTGVALVYRAKGQPEVANFTGDYRTEPGRAVNAAMRLSWKLTQQQDGLLP